MDYTGSDVVAGITMTDDRLVDFFRLASFENTLFLTQYVEEISNHAITANIGCSF